MHVQRLRGPHQPSSEPQTILHGLIEGAMFFHMNMTVPSEMWVTVATHILHLSLCLSLLSLLLSLFHFSPSTSVISSLSHSLLSFPLTSLYPFSRPFFIALNVYVHLPSFLSNFCCKIMWTERLKLHQVHRRHIQLYFWLLLSIQHWAISSKPSQCGIHIQFIHKWNRPISNLSTTISIANQKYYFNKLTNHLNYYMS